jgi:hypothetical protein
MRSSKGAAVGRDDGTVEGHYKRTAKGPNGSRTTSGDANDSDVSSPSTSMATLSVAPMPEGADMVRPALIERKWCALERPALIERWLCSRGPSGATCSDRAMKWLG